MNALICKHIQRETLLNPMFHTLGVEWCSECGACRIAQTIWSGKDDDNTEGGYRWQEWRFPVVSYPRSA